MGRSGSETVPPGRSLFLCALLATNSVHAALNLEGITGYWMVPTAEVIPHNTLEFAASRHDAPNKVGWNWIVGMGALPHMEIAARYAMPLKGPGGDLSFNAKLGYTFLGQTWHPTSVAIGSQDVWGGARLMHATYAVATQRVKWLEVSVGFGNGADHVDTTPMGAAVERLGGLFWGVALDAPLPDSFPLQAALIHDHDANDARSGGRLGLRRGPATLYASVVRDWSDEQWEWAGGLAWALPSARQEMSTDSLRWLRLRFSPWLQSFMGTEVGRFDLHVSVDLTGIVQPIESVLGYARVRDRLWYSDNFADGKTFAYLRQEPALWLEGAGAGWSPSNRLERGLWLQGGVADGSWRGGAIEGWWALWAGGPVAGALLGYWYSPDWNGDREVWMPWIDWQSRDRSWFARFDAGRYWNRDDGFRVRVGRRYGRLAPSMGIARTDATWQMDGRLEIELDGIGWRHGRAVAVEPAPVWGHGYMTTIAKDNGDGNPLRPALAKDPSLPLRGRYGSWP